MNDCKSCDREALMAQVKCLREEKEALEEVQQQNKELHGFNFGLAGETTEQKAQIKELEAQYEGMFKKMVTAGGRIAELESEVSDYLVCNGCGYRNAHDKYGLVPSRLALQNKIKELEAKNKVIYCEAIALLTQVNGSSMKVAVAHDYLTKVYAEQLTKEK